MSGKNELSSDACNYKNKDCCEMQGWIRECGKKEKKQKDLKYICKGCVKVWKFIDLKIRACMRK